MVTELHHTAVCPCCDLRAASWPRTHKGRYCVQRSCTCKGWYATSAAVATAKETFNWVNNCALPTGTASISFGVVYKANKNKPNTRHTAQKHLFTVFVSLTVNGRGFMSCEHVFVPYLYYTRFLYYRSICTVWGWTGLVDDCLYEVQVLPGLYSTASYRYLTVSPQANSGLW